MSWEQGELEFQDDVVEKAEGLRSYQRGIESYDKFLSMYWEDEDMQEHLRACKIRAFLNERLPLDYEPFTEKIKWEPTGLTNVHGGRVYGSLLEAVRRRRKPVPLPVDVNFYTFDMIRHAYDMGDLSGEEYLENVRRKVAFENEGN